MIFLSSLLKLRNNINNIDKKLILLLSKRQLLSKKIVKVKTDYKKEIRDKKREKNMLETLTVIGKQYNLKKKFILSLFQVIIKESIRIQKKNFRKNCNNEKNITKKVSFLGPKGSYSYIASTLYFRKKIKNVKFISHFSFKKIISSVEKNKSEYCILPIYNTCSGFILKSCKLLLTTHLKVIGEIEIPINHCLLTIKNTCIEDIDVVYSHEEALKQCSTFISQFPKWKIKITNSTSDAMNIVSVNKHKNWAAIGNKIGTNLYHLNKLKKNLSNKKLNITRFFILSKENILFENNTSYKTTVIFSINKTSNFLKKMFFLLKNKRFCIKKIKLLHNLSNNIQLVFFMDIIGNLSNKNLLLIIQTFIKVTNFLKILGCYPYKIKKNKYI